MAIYRGQGQYVAGQYNYDLDNIDFENEVLRRETVNGKTYLIYDIFRSTLPGGKERGYWIRGAESITYSRLFSRSLFTVLLMVMPVILLLAVLGGYFITSKAFSPVNNIIRTADEIYADNNISKRVSLSPNSHKDELYNLSVTINRMLDRIENLIAQEKQFTSDASHELSTPIGVILAQGEYLLEIAQGEKQREPAGDIVSKANQASKLISKLLMLSAVMALGAVPVFAASDEAADENVAEIRPLTSFLKRENAEGKFRFTKAELSEEQKAAMAEKLENGEITFAKPEGKHSKARKTALGRITKEKATPRRGGFGIISK